MSRRIPGGINPQHRAPGLQALQAAHLHRGEGVGTPCRFTAGDHLGKELLDWSASVQVRLAVLVAAVIVVIAIEKNLFG